MAFAEQRLGLTGSSTGWILTGGGIGGMAIPWLIGPLFERFSPRITMPVLLVSCLIAFGLLITMIILQQNKEILE